MPLGGVGCTADLGRIVVEQGGLPPVKIIASRRRLLGEPAACMRDIRTVAVRLDVGGEFGAQRGQAFAARASLEQRCDRVGRRGIPELVEGTGNLADDRADRQDVQVAEGHLAGCLEVLVADVASAQDRHLIVGDECLVVHAAIDTGKIAEHAEPAEGARGDRIEQAGSRCWGVNRWLSRTSSLACAPTSSSSTRTRTPRSAARSSALAKMRPVRSSCQM